jgi:hypothetical protein
MPVGYSAARSSSRLVTAVPALPAATAPKAAEHPIGLARLARIPRMSSTSSGWQRRLDAALFRTRGPAVFTAHDLLPRRTAHRENLWRRLLRSFDRIVVHSERGREALAAVGVDPGVFG